MILLYFGPNSNSFGPKSRELANVDETRGARDAVLALLIKPHRKALRNGAVLPFVYANYLFVYLSPTRTCRPLADWPSNAIVLGSCERPQRCWATGTMGVPDVFASVKIMLAVGAYSWRPY